MRRNNGFTLIWALLLVLGMVIQPIAVMAATADDDLIQLKLSSNESEVPSGQPYTYTMHYSVSSITLASFDHAEIQLNLPVQVVCDKTINDSRTSSSCPARGSPVIFRFDSPLPAGSTGTLQVDAKFPNYTTPSGTTAVATSEFTSDAGSKASNEVTVRSTATSDWQLTKQKTSPEADPMPGGEAIYTITLTDKVASKYGRLQLNDVNMWDTLPDGATCLSATEGTCDNANHGVFWSVYGPYNDSKTFTVKVKYDAAVSGTVTNRVYADAKPLGEAPIHLDASATHAFVGPTDKGPQGLFYKSVNVHQQEISPGQDVTFTIGGLHNRANDTIRSMVIVDMTPSELKLKSVRTAVLQQLGSVAYNVYYTTDAGSNPAWQLWSAVDAQSGQVLDATALPGRVTGVEFALGDLPIDVRQASLFELTYELPASYPVPTGGGTLTNSADLSYTFNGSVATASEQADVRVVNSRPLLDVKKAVLNGYYFNPGDTVKYGLTVTNTVYSSDDFHDPVVYDLLPAELDNIIGDPVVQDAALGKDPVFEKVPDYNGTGRTLLLWKWQAEDGNAATLPVGKSFTITFDAHIKNYTPTGIVWNRVEVLSKQQDYLNDYNFQRQAVDTEDHDGDGKTTGDYLVYADDDMYVNSVTNLDSVKWVHGELDVNPDGTPKWTKYPDVGQTTPGGTVDYKLIVTNTGNRDVKDAVIVDALPRVGDTGVLVSASRGSEWGPVLSGPVTVPSNVYVSYSTDAAVSLTSGTWSDTLPADITKVTALKFVFAPGVIIKPGDEAELVWPMRAPVGAPAGGETAWSSFAYEATRADDGTSMLPAEPNKVGVRIVPNPGAALGDYVWFDENGDGVQNENAAHGLNGVPVTLYKQDGTLLQQAVTGNDFQGNPGYYLFSNLDAGTYYVQFGLPAGYERTVADAGANDAVDSDAHADGTTSVVTLTYGQTNVTLDAGLRLKPGSGGGGGDDGSGGSSDDDSSSSGSTPSGPAQPGNGTTGSTPPGMPPAGSTGGGTPPAGAKPEPGTGELKPGGTQSSGNPPTEGAPGSKPAEIDRPEGQPPEWSAPAKTLPQTGEPVPITPLFGILLCGAALLFVRKGKSRAR